ncbi:MAG TPA: hypothetical protein VHU44_07900 [Acidobacteriaceae bacterium]|nr:hypothetical protein [Acidobacteriaceae bacterium]
MQITIDNLDGKGPRDYSAAVSADGPLKIERVLNQPSRCTGELLFGGCFMPGADPGLTLPARQARIIVSSGFGTILFTGYIATEPEQVYSGFGIAGPIYRAAFTAFSDEWLLDKQATTLTADGFATDASTLLGALAERTAAGVLSTSEATINPVGVFTPGADASFSTTAAGIASASYTAYRAVSGALTLAPVGSTTHSINLDDPAIGEAVQPASLRTANARELVNDVTLTGELEPSAYVTELFTGDGTTAAFTLEHQPFRPSNSTLLTDTFNAATLNPQRWLLTDSGSHIALCSGGLALTGGAGSDGQTTLAAQNQIELGGTLILEADSVQLTAPSDGVLTGLYSGAIQRPDCIAGWNVTQSGGNTVLQPLVSGIPAGSSYVLLSGHVYTLQLRLHSPEPNRQRQTYYARADGVLQSFGGGLVDSPVSVVFELTDLGNASNTPATVLYEGTLATTPAACTYAAVNSLALTGSIGAVSISQSGSAWVTTTTSAGVTTTRLSGLPGTGADFQLSSTGVLTFFAGRIPAAGDTITVRYRTRQRSVARLNNPASVVAEAASGAPGTSRWLGKVVHPPARSSQDCEAAAQAVLALATSRVAALSGGYTAINPAADIWPGDVLAITTNGDTLNVVARSVTLVDGHAAPEWITYRIAFANDWAESLGITLSEAVAPDAELPETALAAPATTLANLTSLAVVSTTTTAIQVDASIDPPTGGGFEVRRSDANFSAKPGADLVLRSPVRAFTIPRATFRETFYIRMVDASTPPVYSRLSAAIITNLAISS